MKRFGWAIAGFAAMTFSAHADVKSGLAELDKGEVVKAAETFGKALEAGEADAAFYLGRMFEMGVGQPQNPKVAIDLYKRGSGAGSAPAKNRLGVLHLEGLGVLQDYEEGSKLVCEAANAGDVNGQFNCGLVKIEGRGVATDEKAGIEYLKKASAANHVGAQNVLAQAYLNGRGVAKDEKAGLELLQKTAAAGNPVGLFSLGQAHAIGLAVPKDLVKAHSYFNLAALQQHPEAAQARQLVERELTPEQVKDAQKIARAWRPAGLDRMSDKVGAPENVSSPTLGVKPVGGAPDAAAGAIAPKPTSGTPPRPTNPSR